jgi:DUF1365 family protein
MSSGVGPLQSKIFVGSVAHTRFLPVRHSFRYNVFMMYLELGTDTHKTFQPYWLWSSDDSLSSVWPPVLARFSPADHLDRNQVIELVAGKRASSGAEALATSVALPCISRVFLLTNFRYLGLVFNPISVYYCFNEGGGLVAIVDEVSNTPWGERIHYVHGLPSPLVADGSTLQLRYRKAMHVSPFFGMAYHYVNTYSLPAAELRLRIDLQNDSTGATDLTATLHLTGLPINQRNLLWLLWRYPVMTLLVLCRIYWQAAVLWAWRRVPYVPKPLSKV